VGVHHALRNSAMDICKMGTDLGTDSETIQAECELIQKQWATNHSLIREGLERETTIVEAVK
jgi:hypothetical protein